MKRYWPRYDRVGLGNEIPPMDYLEWYIPKLIEQREHNLSYSGMQYDWDIDEIIDSSVKELTNPIMDSAQDPRNILSEIYDVPIQNLLLCHGATQAINIAIIAAKTRYPNIDKVTIVAESPTYAPMPQSSLYWTVMSGEWTDLNLNQVLDRGKSTEKHGVRSCRNLRF